MIDQPTIIHRTRVSHFAATASFGFLDRIQLLLFFRYHFFGRIKAVIGGSRLDDKRPHNGRGRRNRVWNSNRWDREERKDGENGRQSIMSEMPGPFFKHPPDPCRKYF